jgi:hypothetical protein
MKERNHRREFIVRVEITLLEFGLELPTSAPSPLALSRDPLQVKYRVTIDPRQPLALSRDPLQVKYRVTIDPRQTFAEVSSLEHDRRPNRAP